MGRSGKRSLLASLFVCKNKRQQQQEEEAMAGQQQQQRYHGTKVRPSDDDDYGRHWYAERDIDRKASEFIDRVHRQMLDNGQDG
ncbi:hypothetical protein BRADI_2g11166v3 [Brachypodium distachyon]|uniref:Uncharacterized protein n=1 Tax=Brachypodium distachyon TaxID=15368 RepID=A0A0Q3FX22_BRADI|nr:hypothetical protein BRADI_2g11166v3 [Brachypodium distachyon]